MFYTSGREDPGPSLLCSIKTIKESTASIYFEKVFLQSVRLTEGRAIR